MKQINQYIQESILDNEDDIMQNDDFVIIQYLKDNYLIDEIDKSYNINNKTININRSVYAKTNITKILPAGYTFGTIKGDFILIDCNNLTSLEGCPQLVYGEFSCADCNNLTSLEGCPKKVKEGFNCSGCKKLENLKGGPKEVGDFRCERSNLINLDGCQKLKVNGFFSCRWSHTLKTLYGMPKKINGSLYCENCPNIEDISDIPKQINGTVYLYCTRTQPKVEFSEDQIRKLSEIKRNIILT